VGAVLVPIFLVGIPLLSPDNAIVGMIGGVVAGLAIVVWWLLFSRARWSERVAGVVMMALAIVAVRRIVDESVANAGMGMMLPMFGIPVVAFGLATWAALSQRLSGGLRWTSMAVSILLAAGLFAVLRTGGITGAGVSDVHWRWTKSPEERLLSEAAGERLQPPSRSFRRPARRNVTHRRHTSR